MIEERHVSYNKDHCWQFDIRLNNLEEDLKAANLTAEQASNLKCEDFDFKVVTDKKEQQRLKEFIKRHEWLGNISQYPTHWFAAYHKNILAGVVILNVPNSFSKLLGDDTANLERLISRGACISWSPKNLASYLTMNAINWMVKNSAYRLFTAYSDPSARELGTIYQACNFYYLGQKSGTGKRYVNPYTGKTVSDRFFRQKTAYKKFAKELGITWQKNWNHPTGMSWENIPDEIETLLRQYSKEKQANAQLLSSVPKHKYAYVLGANKNETRKLRKQFLIRNKIYSYPKDRGK